MFSLCVYSQERALRTPSPEPQPEPRTPEPLDGSSTSAQDLINRVLGNAGTKLPPAPTTPNNWRTGASTDLSLNMLKAPSPLTPFARPPSPTHNRHSSTALRYPPRTPFRTPPPKVRAARTRQVSDSEGRPELSLIERPSLSTGATTSGEASGSTYRTPHLLSTHVLSSGGPDYGLRDMFGLSPMKTPLGNRGMRETNVSSSVLSADAMFKRSLLPPSPFRTPTSSSRYTQPGDDDDDGIERDQEVDVDAAFDEELASVVNGKHRSGEKRKQRRRSSDPTQPQLQLHASYLDDTYDPSAHTGADELARLQEAPVTPLGSSILFHRSGNSQSPSPGNWRMF